MEVLIFQQINKDLSFRRRRNLIKWDSSFVGMITCIKNIFILLTILISFSISAQKLITQEDKIYNAIDVFTANPSEENLNKLELFSKSISTALDVTKTKNELLAIVVLNCNKGYYENKFGQTTQAISSYEKAWQIYQKKKLKEYDIVEFCLKPLGNLYTIIGDYDNAENTIKQYYFIATIDKNQQQKEAAILNLSNIYQNTGRINPAIDLLEKTIQTDKLSNVQKGILLNNLGNNYMINAKGFLINPEPFAKAENCFKTAIKLLKTEKNQSETLSNCYRNLAAFYIHLQHFEKANDYFLLAKKLILQTKNQNPRTLAKLYYEEASLLFEQKKYSEASVIISSVFKILIPNYSYQKSVLPDAKSLYAETILLDALDLQANIFLEQNLPKKALETYSLSFQIEDLFTNLLVYENSKIINQIRIRNRTEKCLSIYDLLYQKEKKIAYIESAFQLSEQTKSGVLKSYLSNKKTASKEEIVYLKQLQNWNIEILKEQQKGELANVSKINEAIKKQNELMLLLKSKRVKELKKSKSDFTIQDLYSKLEKDKAVMVEYFMGFENVYVFTLENQKIKLEHIDVTDTAIPTIISFLDYFSDANKIIDNITAYNHRGNSVYKMLKLPTNSNYQNLIIVPDGILNFLPFEALITQESTTTNFAQMHYLLNDFKIAYTNSATFYLSFDKLKMTNRNDKKTVLGIFPVFAKTNYELTFSKDELQSIKNNFEGNYFENATATFENFKKNAANYSILHLSTHASSGDNTTPASIKFYDQEILYSELYNLKINPDLVVLSACETGIGKLFKSEGAMSIARGFQFAGAQNLLFSLWKVNDYTTSVFMEKFYKNIKKGSSYFDANHQAKLDFLTDKTISNAKKSPYYWSAFVYYGTLETKTKTPNYIFYSIGLLILIGLFLFFNRYRK